MVTEQENGMSEEQPSLNVTPLDVARAHVTESEVQVHPEETPPRPARPNRGPHKSKTQIAAEVQDGKWGEDWFDRVQAAGFNAEAVKYLVDRGVGKQH